jgi:chorismate mutase
MGSTTAALIALRENLAEAEEPILRALRFRIKLPFNGRLYSRLPWFGLSRFDIRLYLREFERALAGSYRRNERPLSTLWLPKTRPERLHVTADIRRGYVDVLQQLCPAGDDPKTYDDACRGDLDALWFLSRRIHDAGVSVGERKLKDADQETLALYQAEARENRLERLIGLLKDEGQEKAVTERVRHKAEEVRLDPDIAERVFRELVFPTTLKLEAMVIARFFQPS